MFETSLLPGAKGARSAFAFSGSLLLQTGVIASIAAASLLMPIALPQVPELLITPPAPRFKDAVRIISSSRTSASSSSAPSPIRRIYRPNFDRDRTVASSRPADFSDAPPLSSLGVPHGDSFSTQGLPGLPQIYTPPPPPKPKPVDPPPSRLAIGGQVLAAQIVNRVNPVYPPLARQTRTEGVVRLHGVISRDGRIVELRVVSGHPLLVRAALEAVQQWTYRPTFLNGQPVEVEAPIEVRFVLSR